MPDKDVSGSPKTSTNSAGPSYGACPVCREGTVRMTEKLAGCDRWKQGCKFSVWKDQFGKKISDKHIKQLLKSGRTDIINGFKKKDGTGTYDARLILDGDWKVRLDFSSPKSKTKPATIKAAAVEPSAGIVFVSVGLSVNPDTCLMQWSVYDKDFKKELRKEEAEQLTVAIASRKAYSSPDEQIKVVPRQQEGMDVHVRVREEQGSYRKFVLSAPETGRLDLVLRTICGAPQKEADSVLRQQEKTTDSDTNVLVSQLKDDVDRANIKLYVELSHIKTALDIYRLIGLNSNCVKSAPGSQFFAMTQMQSLRTLSIGLAKVYEQNDRWQLCSIPGICKLLFKLDKVNPFAVHSFVSAHGIGLSSEWKVDVEKVVQQKQAEFATELTRLKSWRDQTLAHMDLNAARVPAIASFDTLEKMLFFADDFHSFVHAAAVGGYAEPVRNYNHVERHLVQLLEHVGVASPQTVVSS